MKPSIVAIISNELGSILLFKKGKDESRKFKKLFSINNPFNDKLYYHFLRTEKFN